MTDGLAAAGLNEIDIMSLPVQRKGVWSSRGGSASLARGFPLWTQTDCCRSCHHVDVPNSGEEAKVKGARAHSLQGHSPAAAHAASAHTPVPRVTWPFLAGKDTGDPYRKRNYYMKTLKSKLYE